MKKILKLQIAFVFLLAVAPLGAGATVFFSDNFANGSTLNSATPVSPTTNSASYEEVSSQAWGAGIAANDLRFGMGLSGGNICEIQAVFATNAIALTAPGDYIQMTIVFTNTSGIFGNLPAGALTAVGFGLYNSGQVFPLGGGLNGTEGAAGGSVSGGVQNWLGYFAQVSDTTSSLHYQTYARPVQSLAVYDQDLTTQGSSTKSVSANAAPTIGSANTTTLVPGSTNLVYTNIFTVTLVAAGQLAITNNLYNSSGLATSLGGTNSSSAYTTASFDGLAMGFYKKSDPAGAPSNLVDVASITVSGSVTVISGPPSITLQPVPVTVPSGAAGAFIVNAQGFSTAYQWHRNGTNLNTGGNISVINSVDGSSSILAVSSASAADVTSSYYVTVSGAGNYSTNSATASLALTTATNLFYSGTGAWDLNTSPNWNTDDQADQTYDFNFGDPVVFDDGGGGGSVTLTGPYLSAASVTVNEQSISFPYTFTGSGSFAGPGNLIYIGSTKFIINNANTYSGGTIISNASANLVLGNLNGLGTGPVTLALAGGDMDIQVAASSSSGIASDFNVVDNFTIIVDATNTTYGAVFNGNFSGTFGKTLTIEHNPLLATGTNTTRIRAVGGSTVFNANMVLGTSGDTNFVWAPYQASGSQTYNGVISGPGALIHKGTITYFNNTNTYTGGMNLSAGAIGLGIDSSPTTGTVVSGPIGTGPLLMTDDSSSSTTGSGEVFASSGAHTIANPIEFPNGTNNLTLIIGGTNNLTLTGPFTLNGNDNIFTNIYSARTVQVTNAATTTFSGVISDLTNGVTAGYGLIITGNGTNVLGPLILNNTETYTGPTSVTNGAILRVNGSLNAASAVTIATNSTLAGSGTINGKVTVNAGGTLAPGAGSIGTLTVNNNLTNGGNLLFRVNKALSPSQSNDIAVVSGILNNSGTGTLTVTNAGPALVAGDRFVVFNKALANGGALTISNLPALSAGLALSNSLAIDGSVTVVTVSTVLIPTNSAHVTGFNLVSGNVVINGTNGQSGGTYYLLASTNVALPLSQWAAVATNVVNTNGASNNAFTFTGTNVVGGQQKFYILSNTNSNH